MTRRVRFTPLLRAGVFAALAGTASASDIPFTPQPPVASGVGSPTHTAAGDLDGDGDQDLVVAQYGDQAVGWYENEAGDGTLWTRHTVATGVPGALDVHLADVDADGDTDVLVASLDGDAVTWYENDAGNGSAWTAHLIATADGGRSVATADVDRDGDLDVLSAFGDADQVAWHENTTGGGGAWARHIISTAANGAFSVAAADVDRDGDPDALVAASNDGATWYENTGGGAGWTAHVVSTASSTTWAGAADVDRDGDLDVMTIANIGTVLWHENAGGGSGWTVHTISNAVPSAFVGTIADLDADGDLDVLVAQFPQLALQWFENADGAGAAWTPRTVVVTGQVFSSRVAATDLDGDGDPDLAVASFDTGTVQRFRNDTIHSKGCFAPPAAVFTQAAGVYSVAAADLDGDGDLDPASASYADDAIRWYPNVDHAASFLERTISTAAATAVALRAADVDGDGDPDVLGSALGAPALLAWWKNLPGDGSVWTLQTIGTEPSVLGVHAADVDGDGDLDALSAARLSDTIAWHDNVGGSGAAWVRRTVTTSLDDAAAVSTADLDRDGDADVIAAGVAGTVAWFENTAGDGSAWTRWTIATDAPGALAVAVADGDPDVLSASYENDRIAWHENTAGNGTAWTVHTVSTAGDGTQTVAAADIDGDGDLDVVSSSIYDDTVAWHMNTAGNGTVWIRVTVSSAIDWAGAVAIADLDADGDPDLLSAARNASSVFWHANERGQFGLAAASTAPPGAVNGSQVPMLRVSATHLGRIADGDLELARFGVRVEEGPGDPYTTAEANAVIEALRAYRDANGNGVFDLGTDVQVAIVDQLALADGAQAIAFADGDPGVQVAPGASRTYFVIAELTADASDQAPNNFRLVHLGRSPQASAAEDRAHDIPLRLACGHDVPSSVVVPITPVELSGFQVE
jgi:hypothetical protein